MDIWDPSTLTHTHHQVISTDAQQRKLDGECLLDCVKRGDIENVEALVKRVTAIQTDSRGNSPLHVAAQNGRHEICAILLKSPLHNKNARNKLDRTPLQLAAFGATKNHVKCVKLLLESGCNVNVQDKAGVTALHWAVLNDLPHIVKGLIKYGADPNIRWKSNETPIMIAQQQGFDDLVEIMKSCQQDASSIDLSEFEDDVDYSEVSTSSDDQSMHRNHNNFAGFTPQMPKLTRCPLSSLQRLHQSKHSTNFRLNAARTTMIDSDRYRKKAIENTINGKSRMMPMKLTTKQLELPTLQRFDQVRAGSKTATATITSAQAAEKYPVNMVTRTAESYSSMESTKPTLKQVYIIKQPQAVKPLVETVKETYPILQKKPKMQVISPKPMHMAPPALLKIGHERASSNPATVTSAIADSKAKLPNNCHLVTKPAMPTLKQVHFIDRVQTKQLKINGKLPTVNNIRIIRPTLSNAPVQIQSEQVRNMLAIPLEDLIKLKMEVKELKARLAKHEQPE